MAEAGLPRKLSARVFPLSIKLISSPDHSDILIHHFESLDEAGMQNSAR